MTHTRIKLLLTCILSGVLLQESARAADTPTVKLTTKKGEVMVGSDFELTVHVGKAKDLYGVDLEIVYDNEYFSILDANERKPMAQGQPGNFFNPKKGSVLRHKGTDETGEFSYVMSLLNPAKEVSGRGRLMRIDFTALKKGKGTISFKKVAFGNKKGEVIHPVIDPENSKLVIEILTEEDLKKRRRARRNRRLFIGVGGLSIALASGYLFSIKKDRAK